MQAPASGLYAGLGDGSYQVGFRAHQLELANGTAGRHAFQGDIVTVTEITGSAARASQPRCFHRLDSRAARRARSPGHVLDAVLDPNNVFVFDVAGREPLRRSRCEGYTAWLAFDLVDLAHSYTGNAAAP